MEEEGFVHKSHVHFHQPCQQLILGVLSFLEKGQKLKYFVHVNVVCVKKLNDAVTSGQTCHTDGRHIPDVGGVGVSVGRQADADQCEYTEQAQPTC